MTQADTSNASTATNDQGIMGEVTTDLNKVETAAQDVATKVENDVDAIKQDLSDL